MVHSSERQSQLSNSRGAGEESSRRLFTISFLLLLFSFFLSWGLGWLPGVATALAAAANAILLTASIIAAVVGENIWDRKRRRR